jgi:hypothetical protein
MRGLYLKLTPTGDITLEPEVVNTNLDLIRQNAAIILLTLPGSDDLFPSKGTDLLTDATFGKIIDINSAKHSGNFAALKIKAFINTYEYAENINAGDVYADIKVQPSTAENGVLKFDMVFDKNTVVSGATTF